MNLNYQSSRGHKSRVFANYKDLDIPKSIKVGIQESLYFIVTDPSRRLSPFLG